MPDAGAEWLVEEGIAEHRAVRLDGDRIVEARIDWPGRLAADWVIDAKLVSRSAGNARGTALAHSGEEVLIDRLPRDVGEGTVLRLQITRQALEGPGRFKRAQARPSTTALCQPSLAERLRAQAREVRLVRRFPADWDELVDEVLAAEVAFPGGSLLFAPTPAMTTIDIDGGLAPRALALTAIPELARALRRFDLGGSIAIDFPTLPEKADRRAIGEALDAALAGWPHERTAMNGFGLVQLVARLDRPSLLHLAASQRQGLVWRRLLRRAEGLEGHGPVELVIHPSLEPAIEPAHLTELERRTGVRVKVSKVATLAPEAPQAQRVPND